MVLGHENMGVVEAVGPGVERVQIGDRVSVPFNLACGTCRNCNDGWTSACLRANPSGDPGAGYGYPKMGPSWGAKRSSCGCRGRTSTYSNSPEAWMTPRLSAVTGR
jgi:glutathione-independent formaldehyde dehydrogenase